MPEIKRNILNPTFWKNCLDNRYLWIMSIVFSIAIAIRIIFFIGYGLGDDSIYFIALYNILNYGYTSLDFNYIMNYRIGLYLPTSLFFSIFGINDFSYVLYPLLTSLGSIIVIYFIGKELFGKETGVIAAVLMTFCPFDAVFASTMTIDIMTSFFAALCFLLFIKGHNERSWKYILYFVFASLVLFYNYMIKIPSVLIICCFACITLINIRAFLRHLVFYLSFSILLIISFLVDYSLTGDFLNHFHILRSQSAVAIGSYSSILLEYIWWMFYRMPDGSLLYGCLFYVLIPALLYVGIRRFRPSYTVIIWVLSIFILHEFLPTHFALPYQPGPRFPRYTHAFLIPSVLVIAAALYSMLKWKKHLFAVCITGIIMISIVESYILHRTWADPFSDTKEASQFLATISPEKQIIADSWFFMRYEFDTGLKKRHFVVWALNGKQLQRDIIQKNDYTELWNVSDGYVVAGGSRGPYVSMNTILNLDDNKPPENWKLLKEIPKKLTPFRRETLKIFEISPRLTVKHDEDN